MFIPAVIFTVLFYVGLDRLPMAGSVKRFTFSLSAGFAGPLCDMCWLEATPPFMFYAQALYPLRLLQVALGLWILAEARQVRDEWNHTILFSVMGMCACCMVCWIVAYPLLLYGLLDEQLTQSRQIAWEKHAQWTSGRCSVQGIATTDSANE